MTLSCNQNGGMQREGERVNAKKRNKYKKKQIQKATNQAIILL